MPYWRFVTEGTLLHSLCAVCQEWVGPFIHNLLPELLHVVRRYGNTRLLPIEPMKLFKVMGTR
jgi:hypothetical protein